MTNKPEFMTIRLLSDTTFAGPDNGASSPDIEIATDASGIPVCPGRTLKGLLKESWLSMQPHFPELHEASMRIFGKHAALSETSILSVLDGSLSDNLRAVVLDSLRRKDSPLQPADILESLTEIRSQTAMDRDGTPLEGSLRQSRVLIRGLVLHARLRWACDPQEEDLRCLAMSALASRHAGLLRNRGRGHVEILLCGDRDLTLSLAVGRCGQ